MLRTALRFGALVALAIALPASVRATTAMTTPVQAGAQLTPADAAPFVGEWTLALQGPNGPGTFGLRVDVEKEKVVAEISNEQMPKQAITDISLVKKSLVLGYSFTWEGNPVSAVVTLTPAEDGKTTNAQIDFAGGAYIMTGTATKKEKPKA
jgi:hypothetical protein